MTATRPIIMTGESVRAYMDLRKSETRRVMNPQPQNPDRITYNEDSGLWDVVYGNFVMYSIRCPYGKPGDRLYCKETWGYRGRSWTIGVEQSEVYIAYKADNASTTILRHEDDNSGLPRQRKPHEGESKFDYSDYLSSYWKSWRSPLFMPRWASRITLEIVSLRAECLQDITEEGARAEGIYQWKENHGYGMDVPFSPHNTAREAFIELWDAINAKRGYPFARNPWVWVLGTKLVTTPIGDNNNG